MDAKEIVGFIILLVIGLSMTAVVQSTCNEAITGPLLYYTNATTNSAISDNTGNVPDDWENLTNPTISFYVTNEWNSGGYLTTTRSDADNGDNAENGVWYQALTISNIRDGITAATTDFEFRVLDNDNVGSILVEVLLCDGTDNTRLYYDNVTDSETGWTRIENNVFDNIVVTGTYTLYMRAEINAIQGVGGETSAIIGWDDASITVTTAERNSLTGASAIILNLVPLFYIIGLLLVAVAWISKGFKK